MDDTLNNFVDELNKQKDFSAEVKCYKEAMRSAHYLFGEYAFRKMASSVSRKLAIHKLLILCLSVLLSFYPLEEIERRFQRNSLVEPLRRLISI